MQHKAYKYSLYEYIWTSIRFLERSILKKPIV